MNNIYEILTDRNILDVLDGDTKGEQVNYNGYQFTYGLPYLSGNNIRSLSEKYGYVNQEDKYFSRWKLLENLIIFGIQNNCIENILTEIFSKGNFYDYDREQVNKFNNQEEFSEYYENCINFAIQKINLLLDFKKCKLLVGEKVQLVTKNDVVYPEEIDEQRLEILVSKAKDSMDNGDYESVITKSRTILEELFLYLLEQKNVKNDNKGNLKRLFKEVRENYKLNQGEKVDRSVNTLISGLNNIVSGIGDLRNNVGDAHAHGKEKIEVNESLAKLSLNSAIIVTKFFLELIPNDFEEIIKK